ncbi:helix-turn-helix domain-containing protein [Actinomadura oligospora]|uniref:helix-turn-helix domain-containing protein n=1 Tax=Actinomadura oligospora TaxID=111804 RepID=UPI0004AF9C8A|nr:helix-turn-helix domain-containing protein [Actinomadura oligospora]
MSEQAGRDPDVLTTAELAAKLGLSAQTVRRMANAGQIPALKTGKDFRYSWDAVREVLRQPHREPETSVPEEPEPKKGAGYRAQRRARSGAASTDSEN